MGDVHQSDQSGLDHLELKQGHDSESFSEAENPSPFGASDHIDCHHCCHCHNIFPAFLTVHSCGLVPSRSDRNASVYLLVYQSNFVSPGLRPPIA